MAYRSVLAVSLLVFSIACGSSTDPDGECAISARVNDVIYCGGLDNAFVSIGNLNVASSNEVAALAVNFGVGATIGTKTVGSGVALSFQVETTGGTWIAAGLVGTGSLTIATLTSTSASGTFSCVAQPAGGGANGAMVVTNGTFNVTFPAG